MHVLRKKDPLVEKFKSRSKYTYNEQGKTKSGFNITTERETQQKLQARTHSMLSM
jgi:hypothetical protein